jgi:peptide/nickel transport system substrate-binding protein
MAAGNLSAFLVACGGDENGGGQLVTGVPATPAGLDREYHLSPGSLEAIDALYDNLTGYKLVKSEDDPSISVPDFDTLEGRLAESWEPSADGMTWTFKLRRGVQSHAGNEMTAEDVKWTWDRAFALEAVGTFFTTVMRIPDADSIKAVDKYTVSFTSSEPVALVPRILSVQLTKVIDSVEAKKHATDADPWAAEWLKNHEAGHGAFSLESIKPGEQAVFDGFDDYYRGKPAVDKVLYKEVPSSATRLSLLQGGGLDMAAELSEREYRQLSQRDDIKVVSVPSNRMMRVVLSHTEPLFKDIRVRQALNMALNQEEVIETAFFGKGTAMKSSIPPIFPDYTDEFWAYDFDVDAAKSLMADAGHPDGFDLRVMYSSEVAAEEPIAVLLRTAWEAIGVNIQLDKQPPAAYNDNTVNNKFQAAIHRETPILPDAAYAARLYWGTDSPLNIARYSNKKLDDLIVASLSEGDEAKHSDLNVQIQKTIVEDIPDVFLAWPNYQIALRDSVSGFVWIPENSVRFDQLKTS